MRIPTALPHRTRRRRTFALAILLCACGNRATQPDSRCPPPTTEFPPVACAIVRGIARDQTGRALVSVGLRVDSFIPGGGYAYSSSAEAVGPDGSFELLVRRVNQLTPRTTPDSASVEIKLYAAIDPAAGDPQLAAVLVKMSFAPWGSPVVPTITDLIFPIQR